jgi:hypothetical protein
VTCCKTALRKQPKPHQRLLKGLQKPPFWRRGKPSAKYDITLLRSAQLPRGQRFETLADARAESERSEKLLRSFSAGSKVIAEYLQECRAGYYECNKPFCPICARQFRRWFTGELLRVTENQKDVHVYTVLLKEAERSKIDELDPVPFRALIRKRLERSGLGNAPVIGGIEIVYRASKRTWMLHANLVVIGADKRTCEGLEDILANENLERSVIRAALKNRAEQLSYVLKFTTYHRPQEQQGPARAPAKPLNPREHAALVKWMSQFEFQDFLLLINARRQSGSKIVLSRPAATKSAAP